MGREGDGFDIDSTMQMLTALGWTGTRDDVRAVATDVFRDHLLNFKIDAARHWGEEFWKQQPMDALREAAEADSTDLFKEPEGGLVQVVLSRQEQVLKEPTAYPQPEWTRHRSRF